MIKKLFNKAYSLTHPRRILLYHRIASTDIDPWELCVSPELFEQQIVWLKKKRKVIPLEQYVIEWKSNKLAKNSIAITFDDGYLDNYTTAKPILEAYEIPATFFIPSGPVTEGSYFWWDELQCIFLEKEVLPSSLSITINGHNIRRDLGREAEQTASLKKQIREWKPSGQNESARASVFLELWKQIRLLAADSRQSIMDQLKAWASITTDAVPFSLMTAEQVQSMSGHKLFDIGSHTLTHPVLAELDITSQEKELGESRRMLHEMTGGSISLLAFPYGNYNASTLELAEKIGYKAAFTTEPDKTGKIENCFRLPRSGVTKEMNAFKQHLRRY